MSNRIRKVGSVKNELIAKSKESMLTAVQIFNNPNIQFKSESFIVLAIIAWTYLLHAYYRSKKVEYRYFQKKGRRRKFETTKHKAHKYWGLKTCLDNEQSPVDKMTAENLKFLIGLRHEIEHRMTTKIDNLLNARFQACCLNYSHYFKKLFPRQDGIEKHLSFSLQFSSLSEEHIGQFRNHRDLPNNIYSYIRTFEENLSDNDFNDQRFAYRVLFTPKTANRKGQADKVIEFISADSEIAKNMNKDYVILRDREKTKYLPGDIWNAMQKAGFKKFKPYQHLVLWRAEDAKNPSKGYGVQVAKTWYWYESWLQFVRQHCEQNRAKYTE